MKYIGENSIKKLIYLIKGDLATKQDSIAATGVLERDTTGVINGVETVGATLVETQEATLVDVPNGLLKGDGTTISAAVAGTDYVNSSQAIRYDAAQSLTDAQKAQARNNISAMQGIESTDHPGCYYVLNGSAVEWINPPMLLGVEYRTTERYLGKPVYVKTVQAFESLTGSDAVDLCDVPVNNADKCISCTGETATNWSLPSDVIGGSNSYIYIGAYVFDTNLIKIYARTNYSTSWSQAIRVTIKYTKTTD